MTTFRFGGHVLHHADMRAALARIEDNSIDACVSDPPYHLTSVVKRFGKEGSAPAKFGSDGAFSRSSKGFMGKTWDGGDISFDSETWAEVLRVLKPGGHIVAFAGTRTYHRIACAIEDAGFEIRDQLAWCYGTGFPKSHDVSKAIDKAAGAEREVIGPRANVHSRGDHKLNEGWKRPWMDNPAAVERSMSDTAPATDAARQWEGWGTALKPAWEPICLARKPLSEKTVAANVLRWGTGAINVDACKVGDEVLAAQTAGQAKLGTFERHDMVTPERIGRFPANLCHDGSDEVLAAFPESKGQQGDLKSSNPRPAKTCFGDMAAPLPHRARNDSGSAARFFYSAKASKADRALSKHPTVKPVKLMQWLCRMVTPPGGTVLDPFAGSGTTGAAAHLEGFRSVLIERESEYVADILRRAKSMGEAMPDDEIDEIVAEHGLPELSASMVLRPRFDLNAQIATLGADSLLPPERLAA